MPSDRRSRFEEGNPAQIDTDKTSAAARRCALVLACASLTGAAQAAPVAASGGLRSVGAGTPAAVARGTGAVGPHAPQAQLEINVGLGVREPGELQRVIAAASTPGSPSYGHYLTEAQYMSRFAPTATQVGAAESWLRRRGLQVGGVSRDRGVVHVAATTGAAAAAFGTAIEDYSAGGVAFYANARSPSVPAGLDVNWVGGLSDYRHGVAAAKCAEARCGYEGQDFRTAYDVTGTGEGQTIGFTLWGKPLPQSDYEKYAADVEAQPLKVGATGPEGLQFVPVGGSSTVEEAGEIALDTENAHGVAPRAHETYWLGNNAEGVTLETVLDEAASSPVEVISNSWYLNGACEADAIMEAALQHGAATGKTFYFATGDFGASHGCTFPSASDYAVAVGGTELEADSEGHLVGEEAFNNDGGCTNAEPRPSWQTGIGAPVQWPATGCEGRATPDVAADSCFSSEGSGLGCWSLIVFGGHAEEFGGTSLATPIWAGASAVWDANDVAAGRSPLGFDPPLIYALANDPVTYARDFHDVTSGSNGFGAVKGWDEATGWGSVDFGNLASNAADVQYAGPASAVGGQAVTVSARLADHGTSNPMPGRTIRFSLAGASCEAATDQTGTASCALTPGAAPGVPAAVEAAFAGDAAYLPAAASAPFTVAAPPPPPVQPAIVTPKPPPSAAQVRAGILTTLRSARGLSHARLRRQGATSETFSAPMAGTLTISWYYLPRGAHLSRRASPVLVATGRAVCTLTKPFKIKIVLTPAGKRLLKRLPRPPLTAKGVFAPLHGAAVSALFHFRLG